MAPTNREWAVYYEVVRGLPLTRVAWSYDLTQEKVIAIYSRCMEWRKKEGLDAYA